jgi:hypothetical protein
MASQQVHSSLSQLPAPPDVFGDSVNMGRKIIKDFTFSNGIFIPAGNTVTVAGWPMHHDEVSPR